jgi:hypothetical protein
MSLKLPEEFTAELMHKKTEDELEYVIQNQLETICSHIMRAVEAGEFELERGIPTHDRVKELLEQRGFKIEELCGNPDIIRIKW